MKRLQQDSQLAVARGREAVRERKDIELKELRLKMGQVHTCLHVAMLKSIISCS